MLDEINQVEEKLFNLKKEKNAWTPEDSLNISNRSNHDSKKDYDNDEELSYCRDLDSVDWSCISYN